MFTDLVLKTFGYTKKSQKLNKILIYRYLNVKYYYVQYCKKACFGLKKSGQKKNLPAGGRF
ncbi:MAG: hypothetical protein COA80_08145 [Leeuwenhoekiella sp.]|nr:MAG: hypothetical protein COA80_08145 [Leeuwenhoekiella sp.]